MMADKNMVSLITELERRYLECSICTEVFDEDRRTPRLLPCHHSFCSECLKRLGRKKDTLRCPSCNAVHKVEKKSPLDFPKDNTRRDLTSFLQTHSDLNAYIKCCKCDRTVDVTYTCQQCKIDVCEICRQQHITENKSHSLIASNSETFQEKEDNLDICQIPDHERAKMKYFCNSALCQCVLCPFCALNDHRDINKHELENIEEAFSKKKKQLGLHIESLRWRMSNVKLRSQKVQDNINGLKDENYEFQKNVHAIFDRGITVLQIKKRTLLEKYDHELQTKILKAHFQENTLDMFLENANACCDLSEQIINCNSMGPFFSAQQTVENELKRYINTAVEDTTLDENYSEEKMDFEDYLRSFKSNVDYLENNEDTAPYLELAQEKQHKSIWSKTKNAVHILLARLQNTRTEFRNDEYLYEEQLNELHDEDIMRMADRRNIVRVYRRQPLTIDEYLASLIKRFANRFPRLYMLLMFAIMVSITIHCYYYKKT